MLNSLAATTQTEHQVKGRLLLDVVVAQSAAILQLLASKDETLLIWRDALFVLNLGLHSPSLPQSLPPIVATRGVPGVVW